MKSELQFFNWWVCNNVIAKVPSYKIRQQYYRSLLRFKIGKKTYIQMGCFFYGFNDVKRGFFRIGDNCVINRNCVLDTRGGLILGNNVNISSDVMILTADHDINDPKFKSRPKSVLIEDYVWVASRATVLGGVTIYKGGVVAAGAVVTRDVSAYSIVAGNPASEIGKRDPRLEYKLEWHPLFF